MGRRIALHLRTGSQLKSAHPSFPHVVPGFICQRITALAASPHLWVGKGYRCERVSIACFIQLQVWLGLCKWKSLQREEAGEVRLLPANSSIGKKGANDLCVSRLCSPNNLTLSKEIKVLLFETSASDWEHSCSYISNRWSGKQVLWDS